MMEIDKEKRNILVLPWHGYMSFHFNDNLVIGNPSRRFFGERAIVSRNLEVGEAYDQESDQKYLALDKMVRDNPDADMMIDFLIENNVEYILHFQDLVESDKFEYDWLGSARINIILRSPELILYRIGK